MVESDANSNTWSFISLRGYQLHYLQVFLACLSRNTYALNDYKMEGAVMSSTGLRIIQYDLLQQEASIETKQQDKYIVK